MTPGTPTITRFAPSPTGRLHVGNIRTALVCWLAARQVGGQFLLRLDDTDQARSTEGFVEAIRKDLDWLGPSIGCVVRPHRPIRLHPEIVSRTNYRAGSRWKSKRIRTHAPIMGRPPIRGGRTRNCQAACRKARASPEPGVSPSS